MQPAYRAELIRAAEAPMIAASAPDFLMRQAAHHLASVLRELRAPYVVAAGPGGNGGDGIYAAAELLAAGFPVEVVCPQGGHASALAALEAAGGAIVWAPSFEHYTLVDAIAGLGSRPMSDSTWQWWQELSRRADAVVAVDVPTGLDADSGVGSPSVTADLTVTFGGLRRVHALNPQCGRVRCFDIFDQQGKSLAAALSKQNFQPADTLQYVDLRDGVAFPLGSLEPSFAADKYSGGVVGIHAGSEAYPGAAVLTTCAAVAATPAMVRYLGPCRSEVLSAAPEVVAGQGRVQAWVFGPGSDDPDTLASLLEVKEPLLIDATGLRMLTELREQLRARTAPTLLTPHAGEFEALFGEQSVSEAASTTGAYVLRKGRITQIADPDGFTWNINLGHSWLATPGSGDVLSGVLGAFGARTGGWDLPTIAQGVEVHATAARLSAETRFGAAPTSASKIIQHIPEAIAYCA